MSTTIQHGWKTDHVRDVVIRGQKLVVNKVTWVGEDGKAEPEPPYYEVVMPDGIPDEETFEKAPTRRQLRELLHAYLTESDPSYLRSIGSNLEPVPDEGGPYDMYGVQL